MLTGHRADRRRDAGAWEPFEQKHLFAILSGWPSRMYKPSG